MKEKDKFSFLPYTTYDGIPTMRDSDIYKLYKRCVIQGIDQLVFHDGSINNVGEFVDYIKRPNVLFYVVNYDIFPFGFFWLNRLEKTHAYCHFVIFKDYWGTGLSVVAGKKALQMCTDMFPMVMGMLPVSNSFAIRYMARLGFKRAGEIPGLIWSKEKEEAVKGVVMYITKKELEDEGLS